MTNPAIPLDVARPHVRSGGLRTAIAIGASVALLAVALVPGTGDAAVSTAESGVQRVEIESRPVADGRSSEQPAVFETEVTTTDEFTMVGFTAPDAPSWPADQVEILVGDGGSSWSEPIHVHHEATHAADVGGGTPAIDPVHVGVASRIRIESSQSLDGVVATFLDSRLLAHPAEATQTTRTSEDVVSRSGWGADNSLVNTHCTSKDVPSYGQVDLAVVHHTAGTNDYTPEDVPGILNGILRFHTVDRGWCDVGYNFFVDKFGTVYEGRTGGVTEAVYGAHAYGVNGRSTGVALLGDFEEVAATEPAVDALAELLSWKLPLHDVDPTGDPITITLPTGEDEAFERVAGHQDVLATLCPGAHLYEMLDAIAHQASGYIAEL